MGTVKVTLQTCRNTLTTTTTTTTTTIIKSM